MCKCAISKESLKKNIAKIKRLEAKNKKKYGVYVITNPKTLKPFVFVAPIGVIKKQKTVCCYYNSKGENVDIVRTVKKKVSNEQ